MKRSLISQMRHEWRSNIWMLLELVIVSLILWYLVVLVWSMVAVRISPRGYDTDDLYFGEIRQIEETSDLYEPYDSLHSPVDDCRMLLAQLRANPNVEVVGAGMAIAIYNYNYYGSSISVDTLQYNGNLRRVTPDVIRAYRLESTDGHTTEQLARLIERGDIIVAEPDIKRDYNNPVPFVDREVMIGGDSSMVRHVGAIARGLRRSDYERQWGVIYSPLPENYMPDQVVVRTLPDRGRQFEESLDGFVRRVGNVYLTNLKSAESLRRVAHQDNDLIIRNALICAGYLLAVIFLGFLGSFWFRTQQRVEEIAIRMVNGATRGDIFRRLIGEGMLILLFATLVALPVELAVVHTGLLTSMIDGGVEFTLTTMVVYLSMALSFVSLTLLIVAGICFPARRAMQIDPAYALKDQ